jgi:ribosome maturation factor RimP
MEIRNKRRERCRSLLFFPNMSNEAIISVLEKEISEAISDDPGTFLVDIRIRPTNNFKVFLDADNGLTIEECVSLNRKLYKRLEEEGFFPDGDFSLEVSSPGLDEPLKLHRQYVKNIGRKVEVITTGGEVFGGQLKEVGEEAILLSEERGKAKKKEVVEHTIPFVNIKTTKIQVVF